VYHRVEKTMRWNARKNDSLQAARGVTFEAVVVAIGAGGLLDVVAHPKGDRYPGQRVLVVAIDDYVHLVPFVEERDYLFLKTIIPSRRATREYLGRRPGRGVDVPGGGEAEDEREAGGSREGQGSREGGADAADTKGGRDA
jgi:hypothetical protein